MSWRLAIHTLAGIASTTTTSTAVTNKTNQYMLVNGTNQAMENEPEQISQRLLLWTRRTIQRWQSLLTELTSHNKLLNATLTFLTTYFPGALSQSIVNVEPMEVLTGGSRPRRRGCRAFKLTFASACQRLCGPSQIDVCHSFQLV
jgi:hypothetical protein